MDSDWRLFKGQDKYLYAKILIKQLYKPKNPFNDHDHCEFCMSKFENKEGLTQGYSTEDRDVWICSQCYDDFKERFKWKVKTE